MDEECEYCGAEAGQVCDPYCYGSLRPDDAELAQDWADVGSL